MTQYWFKPKRYGYGATPVTWQGGVVTLATLLVMVGVNVGLRLSEPPHWAIAGIVAFDVLALACLFVVCRRKTEGGWHWRWGDR